MKTAFTHITLGLELAAIMFIFVYGGYRLDLHFDKSPLFVAAGAAFGMAAGLYNLLRALKKIEANRAKKNNGKKDDDEKPSAKWI